MRNCEEKEERLMLLESWRSFEDEFGTEISDEDAEKIETVGAAVDYIVSNS